MGFERARPYECRVAEVALKGSFPCVAPHVVAQMTVRCEGNRTDVTFVGFNAIVDPHVDLEVAAFGEAFIANGAFKGL